MRTITNIAWKDMLVIFRDRAAIILMLGGPLVLTLGMGLVTGSFSRQQTQVFPVIPLLVVNLDEGTLGRNLVDMLESQDMADLVAVTMATNPDLARDQVAAGDYAAAVVIPPGFSAGILPDSATGLLDAPAAPIDIYADPARPISGGVINSIVSDFVRSVSISTTTVSVAINQLMASGEVAPEQLPEIGRQLGETMAGTMSNRPAGLIAVTKENLRPNGTGETEFNPLAYFAPAMALLFLMYTVTVGARSFLIERQQKTLARMLAAPVHVSQVLGGKVLGIFFSGVAQVSVLIGLSALLFRLSWGSPLGVVLLIMAAAAAATGWGLLVASIASTPAQIGTIGTTLMLGFGILGGSFVPLNEVGPFLEALSKLTPNAWALDGFTILAEGGTLTDLAVPLGALGIMAIVLFVVAAFTFSRRQTALLTG